MFPLSIKALWSHLPLALEDAVVNNHYSCNEEPTAKVIQRLCCISEKIDEMTRSVTMLSQQSLRYDAIRSIPGFDPILTTSLISEVGTGNQFQNGR